jgi:hypothetical protein
METTECHVMGQLFVIPETEFQRCLQHLQEQCNNYIISIVVFTNSDFDIFIQPHTAILLETWLQVGQSIGHSYEQCIDAVNIVTLK